jgi:tetratricopeptide (TPR) repeat protein
MGRGTTVVEALDAARTEVDDSFSDSPDVKAAVEAMIGASYGSLGRFREGEELLRSALEAQRRLHGEQSLEVAETLRALADQLVEQGKLQEADELLKRVVQIREARVGADHVLVGEALNSLGNLDFARGDAAAGTRDLRRAVAIFEGQYASLDGKRKRRLAVAVGNLAAALEASDQEEAIRTYRRALELWATLGLKKSPGYAGAVSNYGLLLRDRGDLAAAEPLLREALALDRELMGERHVNVGMSLATLAGLVRDRGEPAAARALFVEGLAILEAGLGADHWRVARAREGLGVCWLREGRMAEAERELLAGHAGLSKALGADDERTRRAADHLAELYATWKRPAEAARYRTVRAPSG